jgi:hypothetical protein
MDGTMRASILTRWGGGGTGVSSREMGTSILPAGGDLRR